MAGRESPHRSGQDRTAATTEPTDVVLDLRDQDPLVDLSDAPTVRLAGPPLPGAALAAPGAASAGYASDLAGLDGAERRDATQRARYVAVLIIAALNVFDIVTTYVAISLGAHEANPVVAWMIASRFMIFAKVFICGGLIFGAILARNRRRRVTLPGLCVAWAVVGVYSLVVVLNTLTVFSHLR